MYRSVLVTVLDDGIDMMAKTQRMLIQTIVARYRSVHDRRENHSQKLSGYGAS